MTEYFKVPFKLKKFHVTPIDLYRLHFLSEWNNKNIIFYVVKTLV